MRARRTPLTRLAIRMVAILWFASIVAGARILLRYESAPGAPATAPQQWPLDAGLERNPGGPTLLVFAHPQCPCTRATLGELDRIAARARERVHLVVVFLAVDEFAESWTKSAMWEQAIGIPGVAVVADHGSRIARRFGAKTSGQTLLYGTSGALLFAGGITAARGHAGDNRGEDAVLELVLGRATQRESTAVFGCPLHDPATDGSPSPR